MRQSLRALRVHNGHYVLRPPRLPSWWCALWAQGPRIRVTALRLCLASGSATPGSQLKGRAHSHGKERRRCAQIHSYCARVSASTIQQAAAKSRIAYKPRASFHASPQYCALVVNCASRTGLARQKQAAKGRRTTHAQTHHEEKQNSQQEPIMVARCYALWNSALSCVSLDDNRETSV